MFVGADERVEAVADWSVISGRAAGSLCREAAMAFGCKSERA